MSEENGEVIRDTTAAINEGVLWRAMGTYPYLEPGSSPRRRLGPGRHQPGEAVSVTGGTLKVLHYLASRYG